MPTKLNSAGKQQPYDEKGRFASANANMITSLNNPLVKEKAEFNIKGNSENKKPIANVIGNENTITIASNNKEEISDIDIMKTTYNGELRDGTWYDNYKYGKGDKIEVADAYVNAKNKMSAYNKFAKKVGMPIYKNEDEFNDALEDGYISVEESGYYDEDSNTTYQWYVMANTWEKQPFKKPKDKIQSFIDSNLTKDYESMELDNGQIIEKESMKNMTSFIKDRINDVKQGDMYRDKDSQMTILYKNGDVVVWNENDDKADYYTKDNNGNKTRQDLDFKKIKTSNIDSVAVDNGSTYSFTGKNVNIIKDNGNYYIDIKEKK